MQTKMFLGWYLVAVMALLLVLQHLGMRNVHREEMARLHAQYATQSVKADPAAVAMTPPAATAAAPAETPATAAPESRIVVASAPRESAKGKPTVPVRLAFRSEPFNQGKIVFVTNQSKNKLACWVSVMRPGTGATHGLPLTLAPGAEVRMTSAGSWDFKSGDQIEIAHSAYAALQAAVP